MNKTKIVLGLFMLIFLLNDSLIAQENISPSPAKNVIHGTLGTLILDNSFHLAYDRLLFKREKGLIKSYYVTLKAGINHQTGIIVDSGNTSSFSQTLGFTGLTGKNHNHFEFSLGLQYYTNDKNNIIYNGSNFSPSVTIGYRKQAIKGFMLRTGVGISEWVYFGLGYSF